MKHAITNIVFATVLGLGGSIGCGASASVDAGEPYAVEDDTLRGSHGRPKPTVVLVHGAWADSLGWQEVIPLLTRDGYPLVAVENPLTSLSDDIATTKRAIDGVGGPVVVVGHSLGGAVITGAAANNTEVRALVYINAFAPDIDETIPELGDKYGPGPLDAALVPDAAGFLFIDGAKFRNVFCADVPKTQASVMAITQKPVSAFEFGQTLDAIAWKTAPSWYLVGTEDQAINPEVQRFMAQRMGAHVTEIASSHASFVSHPQAVAKIIEQAAVATSR